MIESTASESLRWLPAAPLAAAATQVLLLSVFRVHLSRGIVVATSCGAALISFGLSCAALWELIGLTSDRPMLLDHVYSWIDIGTGPLSLTADLAFQFDSLSAVMCLVITGVGSIIHIYSVGYMDADERADGGYQRFFCYLNLFLAAMLVLVLADNLLLLFVGWEGVGLCSYLLIGFWHSDRQHAYAASKAFVVNRVGDLGFLVGLMLLFWSFAASGQSAVSFRGLEAGIDDIAAATVMLPAWLGAGEWGLPSLIGFCFFIAACGKSAQGPLCVWLPDAMAGPTPVSALIHAATMVTAGVYLMCRMSFLYAVAPEVAGVIAWTGAITALLAAVVAATQTDIKKVLAYSTISQLGFMFLAVGCGAYTAAVFHLVTHAFFKSLLLLGAGAVILAMDHEQDMRKMGALRTKLVWVHLMMGIGVAALAGVPPLSGFFSNDEILVAAFAADSLPAASWLYAVALLAAVLTAFYGWRLIFMVFWGRSRLPRRIRSARMDDPNDWIMVPLYGLATMASVIGFFGLPQFWGDWLDVENSDSLGNFVAQSLVVVPAQEIEPSIESSLAAAAFLAAIVGFAIAFQFYVRRVESAPNLRRRFRRTHRLLIGRFFIDEFYDRLLVRPLVWFSDRVLSRTIDTRLLDGLIVNGSAQAVRGIAAGALKHLHSGFAQSYFIFMIAGALAIAIYLFG